MSLPIPLGSTRFARVLSAGIEPASVPSEGTILSIERREGGSILSLLIVLRRTKQGPIVKWYYAFMAWTKAGSDSRWVHQSEFDEEPTRRAAEPRAGCILRQIKFGGHYIKKSEPTSSRTPDFARSACVVALTQKRTLRSPESRHARSTARPALSPCRSSFLFFCGGGILKRNGRQRRGAA